MSDAIRLLAELRDVGALLTVEAGRLRVRAPRGVLSETRREAIEAQREGLLAALSSPSVPELNRLDSVPASSGPLLDETVANALALEPAERAAWQAEIVAAVRYVEDGGDPDPHLAHDLAALRRIVPSGICLDCGGTRPGEGHPWCTECFVKAAATKEVSR